MGDVTSKPPTDAEADLELLNVAEARRAHSDQFAWTVPGLALTAEAFLLSIALNSSTAPLGRLLSVLAGLFPLLSAWHFLSKQSYGFRLYDAVIERQRDRLDRFSLHRETLETLDYPERVAGRLRASKSWWVEHLPSVRLWKLVLVALIVIDLLVGGYAIVEMVHDPGWLSRSAD
jgi:hypothetical protein